METGDTPLTDFTLDILYYRSGYRK